MPSMVDNLSKTERHKWYNEPELVGVEGVVTVDVFTGFKGEGDGGGCDGLKLLSIAEIIPTDGLL